MDKTDLEMSNQETQQETEQETTEKNKTKVILIIPKA